MEEEPTDESEVTDVEESVSAEDEAEVQSTPAPAERMRPKKQRKAERRKRRKKGRGFLLGLLTGAGAGGTLGVLLTPVSGDRAREITKEKAPELWERREQILDQTREKAKDLMARAETMPGGNIIGRVRRFFSAAVERIREAIAEARAGAAEETAEARHRYEIMTRKRRFRGQ